MKFKFREANMHFLVFKTEDGVNISLLSGADAVETADGISTPSQSPPYQGGEKVGASCKDKKLPRLSC